MACHAGPPPVSSTKAEAPEPAQVTVTITPAAPTTPWPDSSGMWLPDGCAVNETESALLIQCPDGGLEARWDRASRDSDRLDAWTKETMLALKDRGSRLVLLGAPTCTVQDEPVPCTRVLGRSDAGVEDTLFLAVGNSPVGGSVEVSCHWSKHADERSYQNLCQQVLRRI